MMAQHAVECTDMAQARSPKELFRLDVKRPKVRLSVRRGEAQRLLSCEEQGHAEYLFGEDLWRRLRDGAWAARKEFRAFVRELVEAALCTRTTCERSWALTGELDPIDTASKQFRRRAAQLIWPKRPNGLFRPRKQTLLLKDV